MYHVMGGVHTGTDFMIVERGTEEYYGPFNTYDEAFEAWKRATFSPKLDICTHRLFIKQS